MYVSVYNWSKLKIQTISINVKRFKTFEDLLFKDLDVVLNNNHSLFMSSHMKRGLLFQYMVFFFFFKTLMPPY